MNRDYSRSLFEQAQRCIPGGVNSPARAFKGVGGTPIFLQSAEGALLHDVDGNTYIDYVGSWGPMILGHAYGPVLDAVRETALYSTSFGAPTEIEVRLAELVITMVPQVEKVRMVNSGTEATMSAVRVARGYTGRNKILKFEGCYHGHFDAFLIKAGSGAATLGEPNSPGITRGIAQDTLLARYNDIAEARQVVERHAKDLAAIIVEPVAGNMGCIPPTAGFLEGLRDLCDQSGAILIFDEVMTGFRLAAGGAQERLGVHADLVTMGKILGAGLPVGAYGGRADIMKVVSPEGSVYQAGTLSGNPLAMAAGYALLHELHTNRSHYTSLEQKTERLHQGLAQVFQEAGIEYTFNRMGSMFTFFFSPNPVTDFQSASQGDNETFKKFFHAMLNEGVYLPPSSYEAMFMSDAHTHNHIDQSIEAARKAFANMKGL